MASGSESGTGRVTLTDVARLAGVSRSAASFALNGRTDLRISEETVARVRDAAEELGYSPNTTAKTLRTGRSGTVALVSDFIGTTSFANSMVRGALQALRDADALLYTVETEGDRAAEARVLQNLLNRDVDGFIYASMFTRRVEVPAVIERAPVVLLNCVSPDDSVPAVVPDERAAGEAAAAALLNAGHRDRIWFVGTFQAGVTGGAAWHGWSPLALTERLAGIRTALHAAGVELAGTLPIERDWDIANGRASVARLLASSTPSALICVNDAVAVGAYQALQDAGLHVPGDVSVVGFDGSPLTEAVVPTLTSLALPHEELGRVAARMLLEDPSAPRTERIPMPLVAGASIAAPAGIR
ncbi:LacI family transcriptional regulator [Microbacterium mangrovi]|uniref:LacI family transcriptional regulator n=1 Tax=Microbacterium mangrovi TaxID=1348253 RepID=A0A0B2A556_9MICO|nr:LacI family DNA-binding transcriptional regulator [Microbacterium mangrovi]KHK96693.1 LacI family transcriptional regulator [Microbacterium mangrovi]